MGHRPCVKVCQPPPMRAVNPHAPLQRGGGPTRAEIRTPNPKVFTLSSHVPLHDNPNPRPSRPRVVIEEVIPRKVFTYRYQTVSRFSLLWGTQCSRDRREIATAREHKKTMARELGTARAQARHSSAAAVKVEETRKTQSLRSRKGAIMLAGHFAAAKKTFDPKQPFVEYAVVEEVAGLPHALTVDAGSSSVRELTEAIYFASLTGDAATLSKVLAPVLPPAEEDQAEVGETATAAAEPWRIADVRGLQPLAIACGHGHVEAARVLLAARADLNAKARSCGRTALHRAAEGGHLGAIDVLLACGANADARDRLGASPLLAAASCGRHQVVSHLLSRASSAPRHLAPPSL